MPLLHTLMLLFSLIATSVATNSHESLNSSSLNESVKMSAEEVTNHAVAVVPVSPLCFFGTVRCWDGTSTCLDPTDFRDCARQPLLRPSSMKVASGTLRSGHQIQLKSIVSTVKHFVDEIVSDTVDAVTDVVRSVVDDVKDCYKGLAGEYPDCPKLATFKSCASSAANLLPVGRAGRIASTLSDILEATTDECKITCGNEQCKSVTTGSRTLTPSPDSPATRPHRAFLVLFVAVAVVAVSA